MKYSKKLIAIASITGAVGIGGIGATALAATNSGTTSYPPIVQKLASTFGLDPAKVNDVFKQQKQDNMANRQAKLKSTLDQAVKDGKLTQDQEDKLIAELQSLRSQAKDNRQDIRTQLQQWAKDNGVTNLDQILPAPVAGIHHTMDKDGDAGDSATSN
jgi:hypothetical protein